MGFESKTGGRILRHLPGEKKWGVVETPKGELPEVDLGKRGRAVLCVLDGTPLLRYHSPRVVRDVIFAGDEINDPKTPWAGKIRWRPQE